VRPRVAILALALVACGSNRLPVPPNGPHVDETPTLVPYPPPPARVEIIPDPPKEMKNPVWIDGEWQWKGRRWVWQRGQWEMPLPGGYYAPSATVALSDGTLAWFPGKWHGPK
jgi:hypothetical protein